MSRRHLLLAVVLAMGFAGARAATFTGKIEELLDEQGAVWALAADSFPAPGLAPYFRWLAVDKREEARYPGYGNSPPLTLLQLRVVEANLRFPEGRLGSLALSLYNRGDVGEVSASQFAGLLAEVERALTTWTGDKGCEPRKTRVAGRDLMRRAWVKDPYALVLTWSSSGVGKRDFRAEYIHLDITPFDPKQDPRKALAASTGGKPVATRAVSTVERVTRHDNGDVFLDGVPMVDQGQKGYCAAAATERVLRFYGLDVTQHVIAQLADADAGRGTNPEIMLKMLKRAGTKFGVRVREHYTAVASLNDLTNLVSRYNRFARKDRADKVVLPTSGTINLADVYGSFEPATFRTYRCEGEKTDYRRFLADVREHVGKGIPLCWAVCLGLVPEEGLPQSGGGHMRLIIGFNDTTQEMIYTDSWGAGHEFKRMSFDDAWTITTGLYSFDPRRQP